MSRTLGILLVALLCLTVFAPLVQADVVAPVPVDEAEDAQLQELETETAEKVEDVEGGLSQIWAIIGIVLVSLILIGAVA